MPKDVYLSGYFQSEKYFGEHKELIRSIFFREKLFKGVNEELHYKMSGEDSVSMHIRRGDKVLNKSYASFYGSLSINYYKKAINYIKEIKNIDQIYVFSDDINWCKENLPEGDNYNFINHNNGSDSYLDILLMASCKNNIIANSSFSWWGAWLNKDQNKVVVAPKKWFASNYYTGKGKIYKTRYYNTKDLYPDDWIVIN